VTAAPVSPARHRASVGSEVRLWLLLAEDTRVALLLLNRARYSLLAHMFGVGPAEANLVTFAGVIGLAEVARQRTAWLRAPGSPSALEIALGAAAAKTALTAIVGASAGGTSSSEMLVTLALLHRLTSPAATAVRGTLRAPLRLRHLIADQAERLQSRAAAAAATVRES
jgi:hypothetical protein